MTNPTTLGKALPIKYGKARNESYGYVAESVPVYGSSGVIGEFNRALTTGPALIVGRKGSAGSIHYSATPCWPIDTVYYAEAPPDSTLHYFRYLLEHLRLGQHDKSTAIPSLGRDDYNAIPVMVPSLGDQERVVAYLDEQLSRLDASVAALHRVQANLKRYRASVLKSACEGRLVPNEAELARQEHRDFETGGQLLRRILIERRLQHASSRKVREPTCLEATPPKVPSGWEWCSLDQIAVEMRNGFGGKPEGDSGTRILRISAVRALAVDMNDVRYLQGQSDLYASDLLCANDLLFTRYNGSREFVGVCAVVPSLTEPTAHPDKLIRVRCIASLALPSFIALMASCGVSRAHLESRMRTTAGQSGISGSDLKSLPIPLPPLAEQHRIVAEADRRLSLIRVAEAQVAANLARAHRLRQSILSSAFAPEI